MYFRASGDVVASVQSVVLCWASRSCAGSGVGLGVVTGVVLAGVCASVSNDFFGFLVAVLSGSITVIISVSSVVSLPFVRVRTWL